MYNLKHLVKEKKRGLDRRAPAPGIEMFAAVFGAWLGPAAQAARPCADGARDRLLNPELEYINF